MSNVFLSETCARVAWTLNQKPTTKLVSELVNSFFLCSTCDDDRRVFVSVSMYIAFWPACHLVIGWFFTHFLLRSISDEALHVPLRLATNLRNYIFASIGKSANKQLVPIFPSTGFEPQSDGEENGQKSFLPADFSGTPRRNWIIVNTWIRSSAVDIFMRQLFWWLLFSIFWLHLYASAHTANEG